MAKAGGLLFSSSSIIKQVMGAITGLFSESLKNSKLETSLVGFVFKPVSGKIIINSIVLFEKKILGTIDLVSYKSVVNSKLFKIFFFFLYFFQKKTC